MDFNKNITESSDSYLDSLYESVKKKPLEAKYFDMKKAYEIYLSCNKKDIMVYKHPDHPTTPYTVFKNCVVINIPNYFNGILYPGQIVDIIFPSVAFIVKGLGANRIDLRELDGYYLKLKFQRKTKQLFDIMKASICELKDLDKREFIPLKARDVLIDT
jgi:hypothetical protein